MIDDRPTIEIKHIQHGWADVAIRLGNQVYAAMVSDLSDGLEAFVAAVEQVLRGPLAGAECRWEHEPAVTSIVIRRCVSADAVELTIGVIDDPFLTDDAVVEFATEFRAFVAISDLARATITAFEEVLEIYGLSGYEERWGFPYPQARLDAIAEYLRRDEQNAVQAEYLSNLPCVLPEIVCNGLLTSSELANALGDSHERVVEALRYLEHLNRFRLEEQDGGVTVVAGSLWPESRLMAMTMCGEPNRG